MEHQPKPLLACANYYKVPDYDKYKNDKKAAKKEHHEYHSADIFDDLDAKAALYFDENLRALTDLDPDDPNGTNDLELRRKKQALQTLQVHSRTPLLVLISDPQTIVLASKHKKRFDLYMDFVGLACQNIDLAQLFPRSQRSGVIREIKHFQMCTDPVKHPVSISFSVRLTLLLKRSSAMHSATEAATCSLARPSPRSLSSKWSTPC